MAYNPEIDLGDVQINAPLANPGELWTMPSYLGSPMVDLCNPDFQPPSPASPAALSDRTRLQRRPWQRVAY